MWQAHALVAPASAAGSGSIRREQADVTTPDGARLLYRETHYVLPGASAGRWVLYRCPDGAPFARKQVHGTARAMAPGFDFEDGRDGHREGVRSEGGAFSVYAGDPGTPEATALTVPDNGVIDAGFDAAVRSRWSELMRGVPVRLQFLVPSRKRFFPVRVQRVASVDWHGIPAERLHMTLDTWFGFAVPDVGLVYGRDDQRLLEFAGTGNVRDARGRNPQVRIAFEQPPVDVAIAELAAVRTLPLDGRCRF